jgi:hypothetical protein
VSAVVRVGFIQIHPASSRPVISKPPPKLLVVGSNCERRPKISPLHRCWCGPTFKLQAPSLKRARTTCPVAVLPIAAKSNQSTYFLTALNTAMPYLLVHIKSMAQSAAIHTKWMT